VYEREKGQVFYAADEIRSGNWAYDGWDRYAMAESASLDPDPKGTVISIR